MNTEKTKVQITIKVREESVRIQGESGETRKDSRQSRVSVVVERGGSGKSQPLLGSLRELLVSAWKVFWKLLPIIIVLLA